MALEKIEALVDKWNEQAALPEIAMARKVSQVNVDASYFQVVLAKGTGKRILDEMRLILDEMVESFETDGNIKGVHLSEVVAKAMVDQETGERGFLITGREEFLGPYEAGQELFKVGIRGLYELNSNAYDIADMKRNIDEIEKLTEEWIEKAAYPEIAAREMMNKHPETIKDVAALLISETGKNILDQIRREFDQFIEVEQNLTAERQANAAAAAFTTKKVIIIVTTASIVFG